MLTKKFNIAVFVLIKYLFIKYICLFLCYL